MLGAQSPGHGRQHFYNLSLDRSRGDEVDCDGLNTDARYSLGLGRRDQTIEFKVVPEDSNGDEVAVAGPPLKRSSDQVYLKWLKITIDAGHIVEGRELGQVLSSHCATFERITGIPTTISQTDIEPILSTTIRSRLFSIAHNALTNAFLHASPNAVEVGLSFGKEEIVLTITDDGLGLPDDDAQRGRGINGMIEDAVRMGGTLMVDGERARGGTTMTCAVPRPFSWRG